MIDIYQILPIVYITGFIITFLFTLLFIASDSGRKGDDGKISKMKWVKSVGICAFLSSFWFILILVVIISIKQEASIEKVW